MRERRAMAVLVGCSVLALGCGSSGDSSPNTGADGSEADSSVVVCPTSGEVWEVAKVYIEHNATDEDTGIHGLIGGEPWESVCVTAPDGAQLWAIAPPDRLGALGVSDFFWESNEPPNDEYSIDDLRSDFPEGSYLVAGRGVDGIDRVANATFTHAIPTEPVITHPPLVPDIDEADPPVIAPEGLEIRWASVTETIDGGPAQITGYQVIVTEEEAEDPNGWARPVYDVHVDPDAAALPVPDEFLKPDTLYEVEVLAIEVSGNQTISVGFFLTS